MLHITADTLRSIASDAYGNLSCTSEDEFEKDLDLSKKIGQQLTKFGRGDTKANARLLTNYAITFFNCFSYEEARSILFFVVDQNQHQRLKSLLVFLNRCHPDYRSNIEMCQAMTKILETATD